MEVLTLSGARAPYSPMDDTPIDLTTGGNRLRESLPLLLQGPALWRNGGSSSSSSSGGVRRDAQQVEGATVLGQEEYTPLAEPLPLAFSPMTSSSPAGVVIPRYIPIPKKRHSKGVTSPTPPPLCEITLDPQQKKARLEHVVGSFRKTRSPSRDPASPEPSDVGDSVRRILEVTNFMGSSEGLFESTPAFREPENRISSTTMPAAFLAPLQQSCPLLGGSPETLKELLRVGGDESAPRGGGGGEGEWRWSSGHYDPGLDHQRHQSSADMRRKGKAQRCHAMEPDDHEEKEEEEEVFRGDIGGVGGGRGGGKTPLSTFDETSTASLLSDSNSTLLRGLLQIQGLQSAASAATSLKDTEVLLSAVHQSQMLYYSYCSQLINTLRAKHILQNQQHKQHLAAQLLSTQQQQQQQQQQLSREKLQETQLDSIIDVENTEEDEEEEEEEVVNEDEDEDLIKDDLQSSSSNSSFPSILQARLQGQEIRLPLERPPSSTGQQPSSTTPCSMEDVSAAAAARKRAPRALTGKHVRPGTGASPSTLISLRHKLEERQKYRDTHGTFPTPTRGSRARGRKR